MHVYVCSLELWGGGGWGGETWTSLVIPELMKTINVALV